MDLDDTESLPDELVARMALYDEGLAEGSDPTFLHSAPITPGLEPHWRRLEACLQRLRRAHVPVPIPGAPGPGPAGSLLPPGLVSDRFGRFRIRAELGRGGRVAGS